MRFFSADAGKETHTVSLASANRHHADMAKLGEEVGGLEATASQKCLTIALSMLGSESRRYEGVQL